MRFLLALIDSLVAFVQRNPLTVLCIVLLTLAAPALLRGIALFMLWFFFGLLLLAVAGLLLFRWRIRSVRKEMEQRFGEGFGTPNGGFGDPGAPFGSEPPRGGFGSSHEEARARSREGEVQVHRTAGAPDKRVSSDVGDYVDFEETKNER